jgi:hypothetical protein
MQVPIWLPSARQRETVVLLHEASGISVQGLCSAAAIYGGHMRCSKHYSVSVSFIFRPVNTSTHAQTKTAQTFLAAFNNGDVRVKDVKDLPK